ncbi:MAG TPA: CvpA family protein [Bryobacteraceae bacterium]|jgi:membrane protein required for colicin V production|nr:CvpA family protein [Bryobacteraceae bacterium]
MNWFDLVILLLILMSVVAGLRSGLARVVVGLAATVAGLLLGFWCYRLVAAYLTRFVGTPAIADILGFLLIFVGVLLLGSLIAALLARIFRWIGLSWFDHLLGGVAGFFRGVLVVAGMAAILVAFVPSPAPAFLAHSRIMPYASQIAAALAEAAPRDLKDSFLQQWNNLKQYWAHPANKQSQVV